MKRMPQTWIGAALGAFALTGLAGCIAGGGYDGEAAWATWAMSEGSTSPAAMSTVAGDAAITWGLRAATYTGRADGRRPRFRITRATAVATTIETARRGTDTARAQAGRTGFRRPTSPKTLSATGCRAPPEWFVIVPGLDVTKKRGSKPWCKSVGSG